MNQIYDPMRYVDQTGAGVAQIGAQAASTLGNFFQQNAQWKQFKASAKSENDAKTKVYNTALEVLKERGIDPSKLNIPTPADKRFTTSEDYIANFSKGFEHLFMGSGNRPTAEDATRIGIQDQPGVKESLAKQSFLDQNDPLNQINLNGKAGTPAPAGMPVSNSQEQINPMLADITGAQQSVPAVQEDEVGKYYDPLAKALIEDVRGGRLSAQAASTELRSILENKSKLQYLKAQGDLAEKKAKIKADEDERKKQREDAASGVLSAHRAGFPVTGKDESEGLNAADVQKNPENYTIGNDNPYKRTDWTTGGRRGGGSKAERVKSIDDRINMLTNDTKQMTDSYGEPLQGLEQQYQLNIKQLKAAQLAKNFIQNAGGEAGLSADDAIQEVSGLQAMKDALEAYVPIVPIMENARNRKPEDILQEGSQYFNQLPKDVYERLRLTLETGESPRAILEKLKRAGL
jgi:hypothetical protein